MTGPERESNGQAWTGLFAECDAMRRRATLAASAQFGLASVAFMWSSGAAHTRLRNL